MRTNSEYILTEWLVLQAQAGHAKALDKLVKLWYPKLLRYAEFHTKNKEDAQDITQESLLVVARTLRQLKDPITFPKWIYTILHRRSVDFVRKNVRTQQLIKEKQAFDQVTIDMHKSDIDKEIDVLTALHKLDKDSAVLVHLHYLEGLSMREIAEIVKVPVGTIKSRLYTTRKKLKKVLDK